MGDKQAEMSAVRGLLEAAVRDGKWTGLLAITQGPNYLTIVHVDALSVCGSSPHPDTGVVLEQTGEQWWVSSYQKGNRIRLFRPNRPVSAKTLTPVMILTAILKTFPALQNITGKLTQEMRVVLDPMAQVRLFYPTVLGVQVHVRSTRFDRLSDFERFHLLRKTFAELERRPVLSPTERWRIYQAYGYGSNEMLPDDPAPWQRHASPWAVFEPGPCELRQGIEDACRCETPADCPRLVNRKSPLQEAPAEDVTSTASASPTLGEVEVAMEAAMTELRQSQAPGAQLLTHVADDPRVKEAFAELMRVTFQVLAERA